MMGVQTRWWTGVWSAMRVLLIVVAGCAAPAVRAPRAEEQKPRWLCEGLGDEACQETLIAQSLCLRQPDGAECGELRAAGWLPAAPPQLASVMGCWLVEEVRDDVPASWICLGEENVAIRGLGVWDVWPHAGWRREDTVSHAGWTTTLVDGRSLWLAVVPDGGLRISDGTGGLAAGLIHGDPGLAAEVDARRGALPSVDEVCAAAGACLEAMPRPAPPAEAPEMEGEGTVEEELLDGARTLLGCYNAWRAAAEGLERAVGLGAIPGGCAEVPAEEEGGWGQQLQPPFAGF